MQCPQCRTESTDDRATCSACGAALTAPPAAVRSTAGTAPLRREIGVILAGLAAIAIALFGAWYLLVRVRSPEAVVRAFIDADIQGRYADQDQYVLPGWSSTFTLSLFQELRKQLGHSPFDHYRIVGTSMYGSTADVRVEIPAPPVGSAPPKSTAPLASTIDITFFVVRHRDEWRIRPEQTAASAAAAFAAYGWRAGTLKLPGGLSLPPLPGFGGGSPGSPAQP